MNKLCVKIGVNMILIDTHIHLYSKEYRDNLDEIIREATKNNIEAIICVAEDTETCIDTLDIASKYDKVYPALGMHPWTAITNYKEIGEVKRIIVENIDRIIAIGEVGLDKKYEAGEKGWERQINTFKTMIELAIEYDKPLNIHSRRAAKDVLEILRVYNVEKAHFHWFTDNEDILKEVVSEGYYVSFTPSITYSKRNQRLAKIVPIEQLLIETDGPISFFGLLKDKLTKPIHVKLVLDKLAEIHETDPTELSKTIWRNFQKIYGAKITI
jgi:TatD DNase family protein